MFFAFDCKLHYLNKGGVTTQQLRIGLAPGKGWNYSHIEKTELGISIIAILSNAFNLNDEMSIFLSSFNLTRFNRSKFFNIESKSFSKLKPYLQKFIPRWQKSLSVKKREFMDGTYTFSAYYEEEKYIFTFDAVRSQIICP